MKPIILSEVLKSHLTPQMKEELTAFFRRQHREALDALVAAEGSDVPRLQGAISTLRSVAPQMGVTL
jgi:hypothetical protein